jgi:hypothetical protein
VYRLDIGQYVQLDPTTRTGYEIAPLAAGLETFTY